MIDWAKKRHGMFELEEMAKTDRSELEQLNLISLEISVSNEGIFLKGVQFRNEIHSFPEIKKY